MSATVTYRRDLTLTIVECYSCGISFGVPEELNRTWLAHHEMSWFCPNGHNQHYIGETEAKKWERRYDFERDLRVSAGAERDQLAASLRTTKGVVTKMRKRAFVGACQFCHRHFANVERHVATKHPSATPETETER